MRKKIALIFMSILMILTITACSKDDEAPEITQVEKEAGLKTMLKKENYTFDSLKRIDFKESDVTEKDMTKLKQKFEHRVDFIKNDVEVTMSTNASKTAAEFSIIYAYYGDEWQPVIFYPINEKSWVSEAKEKVNKNRVMKDLRQTEFKGFKKGYVGKESNTKVILNNRDQKINIGRDILFTTVVVKTDFAKYKIGIDFTYQFKDNKWVLTSTNIQDQKLWQIEYDKDNVPDALSQEAVIKKLTNKKNFLTYVTNKDYVSKTMLSETRETVGVDELAYAFSWMTDYDNIGKITYSVKMPYKFSEGEWQEGKPKVEIDNINAENMVGKWKGENGDEINFTKTMKSKKTENRDLVIGTYYAIREIEDTEVDPTVDPFAKKENKNNEKKSIDPDNPLDENIKEDDEELDEEEKDFDENKEFEIEEKINKLEKQIIKKEITRYSEITKEIDNIKKGLPKDHKFNKDLEKLDKKFVEQLRNPYGFEKMSSMAANRDLVQNMKDIEGYEKKQGRDFTDEEKQELEKIIKEQQTIDNQEEKAEGDTKTVKASYNIKLKLEPTKKDNNWNLKIVQFDPKNTSSVKFDISEARVDLKSKNIIIDGVKYTKDTKDPKEDENKDSEALGKNDGIMVDSMDVQVPAYVIENENYFKIRDLACALMNTKAKFKVDYDQEKNAIVVESGGDYQTIDGDMQPIKNKKSVGTRSYDTLIINGKSEEIKAYKIEGFNYFRLRDLGEILGFGVDYDFDKNKVIISSNNAEENKNKSKSAKKSQEEDMGVSKDKGKSKNTKKKQNDTSAFDEEFNTDSESSESDN